MQPAMGSEGTPPHYSTPNSVCQEDSAAVDKTGQSDVGHAERPFGRPNKNWI